MLAGLALAGCAEGIGVTRAAPERIVVAGQSVVVAGPPGFCVDRSLSRDGGEKAFVLLGSCASIAGRADQPAPRVPALLTVSVSPEVGESVDVADLRQYLRTPSGRAALSRAGDPASVQILDTRSRDGTLYIQARDSSAGLVQGIDDTYWRALFDLNGRLVTASVVGFEARPMSPDLGFATLTALTDRLQRENAAPVVSTRGRLPG